jgi:hypothetical protein
MELGIRNFTEAGNNLMWRKGWETYQREECKSKTRAKMENKVHYDRIFNALTDNRSIDVMVDESLEAVKKMPEKEFIIKYVQENKYKMNPKDIADAIAIALEVKEVNAVRSIFNTVMEQLKNDPIELNDSMRRSIAIDGSVVNIIASNSGVIASANPLSITGVSSMVVDQDSGERGIVVWEGDNQAPVRGVNPTDAGFRMSEVPAQFSVPTILPPPIVPTTFNRQGLPTTSEIPRSIDLKPPPPPKPLAIRWKTEEMSAQTEMSGDYPSADLADVMIPFNVGKTPPQDIMRSQFMYGGKDQGNTSKREREFQAGLKRVNDPQEPLKYQMTKFKESKGTSTLLHEGNEQYSVGSRLNEKAVGLQNYYGIGRPFGSTNIQRTDSGTQIMSPIGGNIRQYFGESSGSQP